LTAPRYSIALIKVSIRRRPEFGFRISAPEQLEVFFVGSDQIDPIFDSDFGERNYAVFYTKAQMAPS
jgi:hypothetical protein